MTMLATCLENIRLTSFYSDDLDVDEWLQWTEFEKAVVMGLNVLVQ